MLHNYLKVAGRNIIKRKLYSFINAFGLSIGIAFCVLICLYIRDEKSFDRFHAHADHILRLEEKSYNRWEKDPADLYQRSAYLPAALLPAVLDEIPEVQCGTRFTSGSGIMRYQDKIFTEQLSYIDPGFFKVFSFSLREGNPDKLFQTPDEIVLTPAVAKKYFGDESPLGKTISMDNNGEKTLTVTGVIEAPPANSSINFSVLMPITQQPFFDKNKDKWGNFSFPIFIRLNDQANLADLPPKLERVVQKYMGDRLEKWRKEGNVSPDIKIFELQFSTLTNIHMNTAVSWDKVSDPQYSFILGGIALLILIIACINYVSLALTTSTARRTEVGVRKVVGAQKKQLVYQFGLESLMLAFVSMFLGLGLVFLFLPAFNEFTGKAIRIGLGDAGLLLGASASITLVVGVLAGSYPALFLSGFRPAQVLKGSFTARLQAGFTRPLVVLQFALSAFLIISSVIMYQQMQYVTTKDLGYNKDQLLVIPTQTSWGEDADKMVERFRTHLQQEPSVVSVAGTSISFNQGWSHYGYKVNGEHKSAYVYAVDPYYLHTLGVEMVMGRNFDARIPADTSAVIVNEALVRDMQWSDPLNEYLNWKEDTVGLGAKVIGVVKDYHFLSLEKDIEPLFLSMDKKSVGYLGTILVKVNPANLPATVEKLRRAWKELSPDKPFDYTFLDEDVARQYESYRRWMGIMGLSTAFAILIACLGLFGLSGINAVNRTKEIGIRKVMGATLAHIFVLLNRQYLTLALVAFVGAIPAAWYVMTHWWLADFKFRIELGWELFAVGMLIGVAVALLTVSYHAIKAAMTNPAETLKYE